MNPAIPVNLGCINGWKAYDSRWQVLKECREKGHTQNIIHDQERHIRTTTCRRCGYTYTADTSG